MKTPWTVAVAGFGLNLALGNLYAWSVFGKQLTAAVGDGGFGWSKTEAAVPFTLATVGLAATMVPAGWLQDRYGPRLAATAGALLAGAGLIVASWASPAKMLPALLGFGLMTGAGMGLGYAAATPAAVKRFPPARRGLIAGFVVAGFGLSPVYLAPLASYLLASYGIGRSFAALGVLVAAIGTLCAQFLGDLTPAGLVPAAVPAEATELAWRQILRDPNFYSLYLQYAGGSIAGLMIIGHLAKIVAIQSRDEIKIGFVLVALLAVFNAGGRIVAGVISDRIGRNFTIALVCFVQSGNMLLFSGYSTVTALIFGAALAGSNYGACSALFPAAVADRWGTKSLGFNYGLLFTAWGAAGVIGPLVGGSIADATGSFAGAYRIAAAILLGAGGLALGRQFGVWGGEKGSGAVAVSN